MDRERLGIHESEDLMYFNIRERKLLEFLLTVEICFPQEAYTQILPNKREREAFRNKIERILNDPMD